MRNTLFFSSYLLLGVLIACHQLSPSPKGLTFSPLTVFPANEQTYMGFAWGDINGDGLPDLAVQEGGYGGALIWYEQSKKGTWTPHVIAEKNPSGIHFSAGDLDIGDIDGDGDIDVLGFEHVGEWQNDYTGDSLPTNLYWFENLDHADRWKQHYIGSMPSYVKDVELADFNRDGKPDLVGISNRTHPQLAIFRQDQKYSWACVASFTLEGLHEGMDVGDIDGDGLIDIACNGYWLHNPGGNLRKPWKAYTIHDRWHNQTEPQLWKNATKTYCQDITGDGKVEIFISHSEMAGFPVAWYSNPNPLSGNWEEHIIAEGFQGVHTLQVGDLDRDGDYDILIGENGDHPIEPDKGIHKVRLFLNSGDNETWESIPLSDAGLYNGLFYDINLDGKLDLCGASGNQGDAYLVQLQY